MATAPGISAEERRTLTSRAAFASTFMAATLLGLKIWSAVATNSVSMLGSLADTALDILASLVTLYAVRVAAEPADDQHGFGHGKAESLAGLIQSAFISGSALLLMMHGNHVGRVEDIWLIGFAALILLLVGRDWWLRRRGCPPRSHRTLLTFWGWGVGGDSVESPPQRCEMAMGSVASRLIGDSHRHWLTRWCGGEPL